MHQPNHMKRHSHNTPCRPRPVLFLIVCDSANAKRTSDEADLDFQKIEIPYCQAILRSLKKPIAGTAVRLAFALVVSTHHVRAIAALLATWRQPSSSCPEGRTKSLRRCHLLRGSARLGWFPCRSCLRCRQCRRCRRDYPAARQLRYRSTITGARLEFPELPLTVTHLMKCQFS